MPQVGSIPPTPPPPETMKPSIAHCQRQQALAIPGMKGLLSELKQAKVNRVDAMLKTPSPYTNASPTVTRLRRSTAVSHEVVRQIEADINAKGGACLLEHEARERNLGAVLVTSLLVLWLGLLGATKQQALLLALPLVVCAPVAVVKATEQFR